MRMVNQGRLIKVMLLLVAAMTGGALILLGLEGKPIKPMAYSLSSQAQLSPVHKVLDIDVGVELRRWERVEYCYRANKGGLSSRFGLTGTLAMSNHFVISDGGVGKDGQIYTSVRWRRQLACQGAGGRRYGQGVVRICVISSTAYPEGTPRQDQRLVSLVSNLTKQCQIAAGDVSLVE